MKLTDVQFQRFYRFIVALQVKEREDVAKSLKRRKAKEEAEKQQRKEEEERAATKKRARGKYRPNKSAAIYPSEDGGWDEEKSSDAGIFDHRGSSFQDESNCDMNSEARSEVSTTLDHSVIKTFKSKHKILDKKTSSSESGGLFGTFVNFLKRSFSSRSDLRNRSSIFSSRSRTSSTMSSGVFLPGISADESDAGSDDGFSQRLTKANLSILREEICGDDAITTYRRLREPSEIEESLKSFGMSSSHDPQSSFEQISSRDQHSSFERMSSRDLLSTFEEVSSFDKDCFMKN